MALERAINLIYFFAYLQFAAFLGFVVLSVAAAQSNAIPVELGQKEIAELLEETVVAKSASVEDDSGESNVVVVVNPVVTEVLQEPVPVGIDAIPVVKSAEVIGYHQFIYVIHYLDHAPQNIT